jgi:hypothetical protein
LYTLGPDLDQKIPIYRVNPRFMYPILRFATMLQRPEALVRYHSTSG